ncbi:M20/M25/M40 family metallo-hydrolase [Siminovitchia sediminis]|uniref:M20/M25/M40 family metallo-hydrolase n=1 Tax=Siminovitchia sediminis TaxID=1274353 RepID=A0ABW4KHC8_9BACI
MRWDVNEIAIEMERLTVELVNVKSVNGTAGEVEIADKIENILRSYPYFEEHPQQVWTKTVDDDPLQRKSVLALLKSEEPSDKTILLHAHTDTVTIDDFGSLKEYAAHPYELMERLKETDLLPEVRADLESGDWLFGRGSVDMKSGAAAHLLVLKYLSENRHVFTGNILFMTNPIEETTHGGIIDVLPELERLQSEEQIDFECAINTDFVGPLYKGDLTRYIYLGSVGKLLPSFYIRGKETHVGQAYEGLDPNLIASEITRRIDLNADLADEAEGEVTQPPVTLKQKDLKPTYNVQTPISSFVYFNYYVHQITPDKILDQLQGIAREAFDDVIETLNTQYNRHCERSGMQYKQLSWKTRVVTYEELYNKVFDLHGEKVNERLNRILDQHAKELDPREVGRLMVEELLLLDNDQSPVIVLFFATPYVPRNFVKGKSKKEQDLLEKLNALIQETEAETGDTFAVHKFFPSLTDSSYLCLDDTDEEVKVLKSNFPGMDTLYPVPIEKIRKLNIPAMNFGTWGKDAHKKTERVYKPYTFGVLPSLLKNYCLKVLNK